MEKETPFMPDYDSEDVHRERIFCKRFGITNHCFRAPPRSPYDA
jgi:hypothetical protein